MTQQSILLVEDDGILAAHTEDVLTALGYRVLKPVATGKEAIQAVAASQPDLVLMDIELAGSLNGIEAARRIRQVSDVPIIYLTGYSQDPLLRSAAVTAPYGYLVKPVPERELAATIEVALYRHRLDREILASRQALRESEERFRMLFESMAEGVALHDMVYDAAGQPVDYRIVSVNPAYERHTGLAAAQCAGRLASELFGTGDAPYLSRFATVATSGEPDTFETYFAPLRRHFLISAACPRPGSFAAVLLDITERIKMEQALERERKKYRALFDNSVDAIFVRDMPGRLIDVNRAACERLGYSREQLLQKRGEDVPPPEEAPQVAARLETLLRTGSASGEVTHVAHDGRRIPTEVSNRLIDYDGIPAVLTVARDISERKRAEATQRESEQFLRNVLDSLPANVAVLDSQGAILAVNDGWIRFGRENGLPASAASANVNYLRVCEEAARAEPGSGAAEALAGIRAVLEGRAPHYSLEYPCHTPTAKRWFVMNVSPLTGGGRGAVVAHTSVTERRLAEETAREKTEELDLFFHTAPDLFCIADAGGCFRRLNPRWTATLGYTPAELVNARFVDFVHPDDMPATLAAIAQLSDQQRVVSFSNRYRCRDGSWRWLEWHSLPAGRMIFAAARDITDRKRAEQALESSQAELRAIYESAPVMMCLIDQNGSVVYANSAFQDCAPGHQGSDGGPGGLLSCVNAMRDPRGCGYSEDCGRCLLRSTLNDSLQRRLPYASFECRLWLENRGERREAVFLASVATIEAAGEPRLLLCLSDITERHRAEHALRRSEENYRVLIEHLPDGVVVHAAGRIVFVNTEAARMLGCTDRDAVVGVPVERFVHPGSLELMRQRRAAIEGGAASLPAVEQRYVREDGSVMEVEVSSVAITYQSRPSIHTVFRDITARKSLEQQLRHAQKMESVGRLAGGVAHDFNNLLTVINGYSQMLAGSLNPSDPMHDTVVEIARAGERAAALTRQLLAFSRKQVMQPRLIDLNGVVREMHSMLRRLVGESIQMRLELDPRPMMVHADPHQFEQAVMNLVINARDALPAGGRVTVSTASQDRAGTPHVLLTVSDNGSGMDEETRKRIFEPFFTTKGPGKGTGLGLAMVQGIVEQSGGSVEVESQPGHGSTFQVLLPCAAGAAALPGGTAQPPAPEGRETILLVEDQREVREYCSAALTRFGYRVLCADGAAAALEICARQGTAIDLVLSDVVMPEVSGPELAGQLRTMRPGLQVLFMSGYAEKELAAHGVRPDEASLLLKPFSPRQLAERVREKLGPPVIRPRILVVDDEPAVRRLMKAVLERAGYEVLEASGCKVALQVVHERPVDLVFAGLPMPGTDAAGAFRALRQELPEVAIVALGKPVRPQELLAAVRQALGRGLGSGIVGGAGLQPGGRPD